MGSLDQAAARAALASARLYGIVDLAYVDPGTAAIVCREMVAGGVQVVQLRAKDLPAERIVALARDLVEECALHSVPLFINDHPGLAAPAGAAGAHVGQDDLGIAEARKAAGPGALIGKSTHSLAQAVAAQAEGADYIGFGPLFATPTKPDYPAIGLHGIETVHEKVSLPIFCIGGIKWENLPEVLARGAHRVVIVSGILQAVDVANYCQACRRLLDTGTLPGL